MPTAITTHAKMNPFFLSCMSTNKRKQRYCPGILLYLVVNSVESVGIHCIFSVDTTLPPVHYSFSAQVTSLNRSAFLIKNFSNKKSTLIKCPGGFSNAIEVEQFMPHFYSRRMYYLLGLLSQFVPSETFGSVFHRLSQLHPISFSFHSWEGQWSPVMPWL